MEPKHRAGTFSKCIVLGKKSIQRKGSVGLMHSVWTKSVLYLEERKKERKIKKGPKRTKTPCLDSQQVALVWERSLGTMLKQRAWTASQCIVLRGEVFKGKNR